MAVVDETWSLRFSSPMAPSIQDRVLLVLYEHRADMEGYEAPEALTHDGMAQAVGVLRPSLLRALKAMAAKGLVSQTRRHIQGAGRKKKVILPTDKGLEQGRSIYKIIAEAEVVLRCGHGREVLTLSDVAKRLGQHTGTRIYIYQLLVPLIKTTDETSIEDILGIIARGTRTEQRSGAGKEAHIHPNFNYLPEVDTFFGRKEELSHLIRSLQSHTRLIVVYGIAGIGKTTLVARAIRSLPLEAQGFWHTILPLNSPESIAYDLTRHAGGRAWRLITQMASKGEIDAILGVKYVIDSAGDGEWILVLDDVQNANQDTRRFIESLVRMAMEGKGMRLILISRNRERVDPRYRPRALYMGLKGLDMASARAMLRAYGRGEKAIKDLYSLTKGHPLALSLVSKGGVSTGMMDFRDFLRNECITGLSAEEMALMKALALLRMPAQARTLLTTLEPRVGSGGGETALERMIKRGFVQPIPTPGFKASASTAHEHVSVAIHDMLVDIIRDEINPGELRSIHAILSDYYEACMKDEADPHILSEYITEHIYHLYEAGLTKRAVEKALGFGEFLLSLNYGPFFDLVERMSQEMGQRPSHMGIERVGKANRGLMELRGDIEAFRGNIKEALDIYEKWARGGVGDGAGKMYSKMGTMYLRSGRLKEAETMLKKAVKAAISAGDNASAGLGYNDLGVIHLTAARNAKGASKRKRELKQAIEAFEEARRVLATAGMESSVATAMINQACAHAMLHETERAERLIESAGLLNIPERSARYRTRAMKAIAYAVFNPSRACAEATDLLRDMEGDNDVRGQEHTVYSLLLEAYRAMGPGQCGVVGVRNMLYMVRDMMKGEITYQRRMVLKEAVELVQRAVLDGGVKPSEAEISMLDAISKNYEVVVRGIVPEADIAFFFAFLGRIHSERREWEHAVRNYLAALRHLEDIHDLRHMVYIYMKVAETYSSMGKTSLAKRYYRKALKSAEEVGNTKAGLECRRKLKALK